MIVLTDIRCGRERLVCGRFTAIFEITYAELRLNGDGDLLRFRSRFGDEPVPNAIRAKTIVSTTTTTDASASASGELSPASTFALKGSASYARKDQRTSESEMPTFAHRVRAKGTQKWDVSEIDGVTPLSGRYIGDDPLCIVDSSAKINSLSLRVLIPKRHFRIHSITDNESGDVKVISNARRRVLEALTAKAFDREGDGLIISSGVLELQHDQD